ncbi:MAG: hypothetical protein WEC75_12425 [Dehalococcoidia bacterium]
MPLALPAPRRIEKASAATLDGRMLTRCLAEVTSAAAGWTATLSQLEEPGQVAAAYFAGGVREVLLRLEDGRTGRARMSATAFVDGQRVCRLSGLGPLG